MGNTIDTNGALHDNLGRYADQNKPAATYDLGDMFAAFDHLVEDAKTSTANSAAREAYPDLYNGHDSMIVDGQYVGDIDPFRKAFKRKYMADNPIAWGDDADEFEDGYGTHAGGWLVVVGASGGRGATEDEAWRDFAADVISARIESGETELSIGQWLAETNAREDRIDDIVERQGGVRFNALYRAGEAPCDTTTVVTLEIDGQSELNAVHTLGSDGNTITAADIATNTDYCRGVVAGIAAAYGPQAGRAFMESIRTGRLDGTFTHNTSAGDVRRAVNMSIPCPNTTNAPLRDELVARNDEYLRGAHQAMTQSNAYWQLGLEDEEGVVEPN